MEKWGFIWLMFALKIPVAALLWLVWWAVKAEPEPEAADDDEGGLGKPRTDPPRPLGPRRRGPHGDPVVPAPPRSRTRARSRDRAAPGRPGG